MPLLRITGAGAFAFRFTALKSAITIANPPGSSVASRPAVPLLRETVVGFDSLPGGQKITRTTTQLWAIIFLYLTGRIEGEDWGPADRTRDAEQGRSFVCLDGGKNCYGRFLPCGHDGKTAPACCFFFIMAGPGAMSREYARTREAGSRKFLSGRRGNYVWQQTI